MSSSSSSSSSSADHPSIAIETKSLLPQHTRPRNIHSPRKSLTRHHSSSDDTPPLPLHHPHHHHPSTNTTNRRCRLLISTLFITTTLLALITLITKFIIFPYLLPTPTPTLRILSLSFSNSSTSSISARLSLSNPTYTSTFHFSDSAYTLHYNSKPISETNPPNLRLQIPPQANLEIAYEMVLERSEEAKRRVEEMVLRGGRGEKVRVDMTVYLYGSSAIRPWSFRMIALFYDCIGIRLDFSAADGGWKPGGGAACQLVEKLTS